MVRSNPSARSAWGVDLQRTPLRTLVGVALLGWLFAAAVGLALFHEPGFDERPRRTVVGEVTRVTTPGLRNGRPSLVFGMSGERVLFQVSSAIFDEALHASVPPELRSGARVSVLVEEKAYRTPYSPEPYRVPTVTADSIEIGGRELLPLAASRRWHRRDRSAGMAILFAGVGVAVAFSVLAGRKRHLLRTSPPASDALAQRQKHVLPLRDRLAELVLLLKLGGVSLLFLFSIRSLRHLEFGAPILFVYCLPRWFQSALWTRFGWPRVAYYFSRLTLPLGFSDVDAAVACFYASRASQGRNDPRLTAKLEAILSDAARLDGGGVVSLGLLAAARGDGEGAWCLLRAAEQLHWRFISRDARRAARDYLVAEAAKRGAWQTVAILGARGPKLSWSYLLGRVGQAFRRDARAPSRFALYGSWLLAPRRRQTWPLVRRALGTQAARLPAPQPQRDAALELPGALGALATVLARGANVERSTLERVTLGIERALQSAATRAEIERRLLGLGAMGVSAEATLERVRRELVSMLAHFIERESQLGGGDSPSELLKQALDELKQTLFRDIQAVCRDYRTRTANKDSLSADAEWLIWARLQATADRVLRVAPDAEIELFHVTFASVCNFAVFQSNERRRHAMAHAMYAWLLRHSAHSPADAELLTRNLRSARVAAGT